MWVVEIYQGFDPWTTIALCFDKRQAEAVAARNHIVDFGKPVRVREYGKRASN